ncbi:MAG: ATP-binding protein [Ornithinimicrobium sp.]|uniref:sensor histidine kinase n=1 Tax=Ornithinimicrobium sp. TaxID=1977084 RepID=UPI0026DF9127|nr:ATP-binding protein [Ornithinimicrobium sp.]MDO5740691.1 ATP-binding protein [Ornithinimicrobium sp.]
MDPVPAFVVGALVALLACAGGWWVTHRRVRAVRRGEAQAATERELAPPGRATLAPLPCALVEALAVLPSDSIVIDRVNKVRAASASTVALGLVRGHDLLHHGLREEVAQVQRDGALREADFDIARGPFGAGRILISARIASIGDGLVLILIQDRTQARRVEEVRRDFVVNVSHELKTPVGGLVLLAEAVQDASDDPVAVARFAGRMQTEAARLTRLVSDIVDLSRLQTGDILADMVLVDVGTCAAEAVEQTSVLAGARDVVAIGPGDAATVRIYGDHEMITTAIRNLVTNAIAYSEDGTRVVVVTRRVEDSVEVVVTDQGRGISPEDQERIFERFYRIDPARSRRTGGTGLGLSIVKHISANHGGAVTVWSQQGQGSTFTLRLPAAQDSRPVGSLALHEPGRPRQVADAAHGENNARHDVTALPAHPSHAMSVDLSKGEPS